MESAIAADVRPTPPDQGFSTSDVASALVGQVDILEFRACEQLIHRWRMCRAVVPSISEANGSGSRVRWSRGDVWRLRRIWEVREQMRRYSMNLSHPLVREMWDALYEGRTPPLERQAELVSLNP